MGYTRVSLRVEEWPAVDRTAWERANMAVGSLEAQGRAATWSAKTRNQVAKDYGRFLFWLRANDRLAQVRSPGERLNREALRCYLEHLQATGMASTSLLSRIRNLRQSVLAMDPDADLRQISSLCSKLKARAEPVRNKLAHVVPTSLLADAAVREYDRQVSNCAAPTPRACHRARDALMMLFLAYLPVRLGSFAQLRIGRNIVRKGDAYWLHLAVADVKEQRPFDCALPDPLNTYIDHYIANIRPRLLHGKPTDHLWVSTRGTGMSNSSIYYQITRITRRLLRRTITPHGFRDCLMTTIATDAPESVRAGARILGHKDLSTGEAHYNFASTVSAQRSYFDVLRTLRRGSGTAAR